MTKYKLFTHTDLDGVGAAIVAKRAFGDSVEITYNDYEEINKNILKFLDEEKITDYSDIFITDISMNDEVAERLDLIHRGGVALVHLVDHHGTALPLNRYDWSHVATKEELLYGELEGREEGMSSGTSLFFKYLLANGYLHDETLKPFVETVRRYDCWEWYNVYNDTHPKRLNDLLYLVGREKFLERFANINPLPLYNDTELTLLEVEEHRINKYIWKKRKEVKIAESTVEGKIIKFGYVFAENYGSQLGNALAEQLAHEVDFVAIFDMATNKVSLRGIHDYIDLGKDVAKVFGELHETRGGGHAKSCAFSLPEGFREDLLTKSFFIGEGK